MSELLDFYHQQAQSHVSDISWLAQLQEKALVDLTRLGFPNRHHEQWRYTPTERLLNDRFFVNHTMGEVPTTLAKTYTSGIPILFVNGQLMTDLVTLQSQLPKGVLIQPITKAAQENPDKLQAYLGGILQHHHAFQALNTAMLHNGLLIYLPENTHISQPLMLIHWQDKAHQASYLRHLVVAESGSFASVIEDFQGQAETEYMTNTVTEVFLAPQSQLNHYKIQREGKHALHTGELVVSQQANSQMHSHAVSIGAKIARSDITVRLQQSGAHCLLNGIYVPSEAQHHEHHTLVAHEVPGCQSDQDYKGVMMAHSRAVFDGKIIVAKEAQHTVAKQQNKNLLLSKQAEIDTKPQLEIYADDVVCTHGATVGQLDEEALFYLATRGIERAEASRYLIRAFAADNLRLFNDTSMSEWIGKLLNLQLG